MSFHPSRSSWSVANFQRESKTRQDQILEHDRLTDDRGGGVENSLHDTECRAEEENMSETVKRPADGNLMRSSKDNQVKKKVRFSSEVMEIAFL